MMETLEYFVCYDCFLYLANNETFEGGPTKAELQSHIARELEGKKGHFCIGLPYLVFEVTGEDSEGYPVNDIEQAIDENEAKNAVLNNLFYTFGKDSSKSLTTRDITDQYETEDFSSRPCKLCNSILYGSRHAVTLMFTE